jgi:hypothetical protein
MNKIDRKHKTRNGRPIKEIEISIEADTIKDKR